MRTATLPTIPPVAYGLADELRRRAGGSTTGARRLGWMNRMNAVYDDDSRQAHRLLQALAVLGDPGAIKGLAEDHQRHGHGFEPGDRVTTPDGHGTATNVDAAEKAFFDVPQDAVTVLIDGDDEGEDRYYAPGDVTHLGHELRVGDLVEHIHTRTRGRVIRVDDPGRQFSIHVRDRVGQVDTCRPTELTKVVTR